MAETENNSVTPSSSNVIGKPVALRCALLMSGLMLVAVVATTPRLHAQRSETTVKQQLAFGVDMARRGLWSEALFRFRQAERLEPNNPSVYNNLAVAHEAIGLFEEALELYRKGLEIDPRDKGLRNNYARFIDFYNRFKPTEDEGDASEAGSAAELGQADGLGATKEAANVADPVDADPPTFDAAQSAVVSVKQIAEADSAAVTEPRPSTGTIRNKRG